MTIDSTNRTRLRIDFQVVEVGIDDNVSEKDFRYIKFGDFVDFCNIKDFFERCSIACEIAFANSFWPTAIKLMSVPVQKINLIKCMRQWTGLGLKETKDLVESRVGKTLVYFNNLKDAKDAITLAKVNGITELELCSLSPSDLTNAVSALSNTKP